VSAMPKAITASCPTKTVEAWRRMVLASNIQ
jgi:hypothetical protein